jgi:hypothetical protein
VQTLHYRTGREVSVGYKKEVRIVIFFDSGCGLANMVFTCMVEYILNGSFCFRFR